jgi:hypothetical protein
MRSLLQAFIDIAFWRRGPQDLPASYGLACLVGVTYAALSFAHIELYGWSLHAASLLVLIDVGMLCGWVFLLLAFFSRRQRFLQTITAVWGVGALLTLLDIGFTATQLLLVGRPEAPSFWIVLRFLAVVLIMGRILRTAIDSGVLTGMALTVAIVFSIDQIVALAVK